MEWAEGSFWPTPLLVPRIPTPPTLGPARGMHPWKMDSQRRVVRGQEGVGPGATQRPLPIYNASFLACFTDDCYRGGVPRSHFSARLSAVHIHDSDCIDCAEIATASGKGRRGCGPPDLTQARITPPPRHVVGHFPGEPTTDRMKRAMRQSEILRGFSCLSIL